MAVSNSTGAGGRQAMLCLLCQLGFPRPEGATRTPAPTPRPFYPLTGGKSICMACHQAGQEEREAQLGSHGRTGSAGSLQGEHTGKVIGG